MGRWRRAMAVVLAVVVVAASAFLGGPILADWLMGAGVGAARPSSATSIAPRISPAPSQLTPAASATTSVSLTPASSPTPVSSPTTPARTATSRIHVVVKGETLIGIAATYGVTVAAIKMANAITDIGLIYVGERLVIPAP
jgi:N-acetylmuramoyl-L-alanine amidase